MVIKDETPPLRLAPTPLTSRPQPRPRGAGWRPGIAWQLGIGFLGVAILAGVANFAVHRTITTTHVVPLPPPQPGQGWIAPPVQPEPSPVERDGTSALPAVDHLGEVAASTALSQNERLRRARAAAAQVRTTLMDLHGSDAGAPADAALRSGERLIRLSAKRREQYDQYAAALAIVDGELQASIDRAWKIFGRVVTRQSMVDLDREFDELQRHAELLRDEQYLPLEVERHRVLQARFVGRLAEAPKNLRNSTAEGSPGIEARFAAAAALSARLLADDSTRAAELPRFENQLAALRTQLRRTATAQRLYPEPQAQGMERLAPRPAPALLAERERWQVAPLTTQQEEAGAISRTQLAWLSAGVLALLLVIGVLTVLSILRPVQRLIRATRRVALGENGVRVPSGAGRELDRLADAFNVMAARLEDAQSMARNYQQQLESRVAERTRQLQHNADHDALTELPNRRQLFQRLRDALAQMEEAGGCAGLFFLDLDNFKNINDGLGHGFGDRVLIGIAERLRTTLGKDASAARFGGDEFTVVACSTAGLQPLREMGWSLVRAFDEPLHIDGRDVQVSVSVGAAFSPEHGSDAESLLSAADAALFRAKALGRSQVAEFTPDLLEAAASRFAIEQGLRLALDRGELELAFQPELDIGTLEVSVVEALLRWRLPDGRCLSPAEFLGVAEESGLIIEINDWVLESSIAAAARWRHAGFGDMRVAVNVSSRQLADPAFPERVRTLLAAHHLPAAMLEIELTETVLQTGRSTVEALRRLQQLGVMVALDDFGTGYSTLASLECLPLDRVKLDRSLIAGVDAGGRSASIASAIIRLCRDLDIRITAEGIERASQLSFLRDQRVLVQGYLLARPLSEAQLLESMTLLPQRLQALLLEAPTSTPPRIESQAPSAGDTVRRRRLVIDAAMRA